MRTSTVIAIHGTHDCWKVATQADSASLTQDRLVTLEIQGDPKAGYHLIMTPEGCFTADSWHPTIDDAMDAAYRIFGVLRGSWTNSL